MSKKFMLTLGMGLFMAAGSAWAFQEERPATPAGEAPAAGVADAQGGEAKANGTDVTIPGLGKLGTLPKMDFGLELLYGANEGKPVDAEPSNPAAAPEPEDLTIRGTMKHNF
jgi:hypothetical protein